MSRYHNRIKNKILSNVRGKKVLDIGSGRGGDVSKWKEALHVYAVEPNPEYIEELERRIEIQGLKHKVTVIQAYGQDYEKISKVIEDQVDIVTMMLSMTFFWQDEEILKALVETIDRNLKDGGMIGFMTMDGDTVEEVFHPYFPGMNFEKLIFHHKREGKGYASIELQPLTEKVEGQGRKAWVYIEDSIVGKRKKTKKRVPRKDNKDFEKLNIPVVKPLLKEKIPEIVPQEEYLVHLMDFERLLEGRRKVASKKIYRAEHEPFLTGAEKDFTILFSYGMYYLQYNKGEIARIEGKEPCYDIRSFLRQIYAEKDYPVDELEEEIYKYINEQNINIECISIPHLEKIGQRLDIVGKLHFNSFFGLNLNLDKLSEVEIESLAAEDQGISFILASIEGNVEVIKDLLLNPEFDAGAQKSNALFQAATRGHTEIVRLLLEDGRSKANAFMLTSTASSGNVETMKLLLEDPSLDTSEALETAIFSRDLEKVRLLLSDDRTDPSYRHNTPLKASLSQFVDEKDLDAKLEILRILLQEERVDPFEDYWFGTTLFQNAVNKGQTEEVKVLLESEKVLSNKKALKQALKVAETSMFEEIAESIKEVL
jgi:SAM-dependent methyltransferase